MTGEEAALADLIEARCRALPGVAVERLGNALVARVGERDDAVALVGHLDTVPPWDGPRAAARGHARDRPRRRRHEGRRRGHPGGARALRAHGAPMSSACSTTARRGRTARTASTRCWRSRACSAGPPSRSSASRRAATSTPAASACSTPISSSTAAPRTARGRGRARARCSAPCRSWSARQPRRSGPSRSRASRSTTRSASRRSTAASRATSCPIALEIALNVRFAPGREAAAVRREIEELVAGEGELTWIDESPAAPPRLSEPVLARFLAETGVRVLPKQAWTDVASLQAHGIPAVNYGPGRGAPGAPARRVGRGRGHRAGGLDARPLPANALKATVAAMRVAKWQGLGNHFLVVERAALAAHAGARAAALRRGARPGSRRGARACARRRRGRGRRAQPRRLDRGGLGQRHPHRGRLRSRATGAERAARAHGRRSWARPSSAPTGASPCASGRPRWTGRRRISARPIRASPTASSRPAIRIACSRSPTPRRSR